MKKKQKIVRLDAEAFSRNTHRALVVFEIWRSDIESGDISSALERLHIMIDSAENIRLYRDSVVISVTGYDQDPRELIEIPEVRAFFQKITEQWPHWLWFMSRDTGSVALILSLLCDVIVRRTPGRPGFGSEFACIQEARDKMNELFIRGNALFSAYGIAEEEAMESANSALKSIFI